MRTRNSPILTAIPTVVLILLSAPGAAGPAPLELEATIPLTSVSGRIDYLAIDAKKHRLFVAELGNNSVNIIDVDKGQTIDRITGLHEPHSEIHWVPKYRYSEDWYDAVNGIRRRRILLTASSFLRHPRTRAIFWTVIAQQWPALARTGPLYLN